MTQSLHFYPSGLLWSYKDCWIRTYFISGVAMPQVRGLESKREVVPCPAALAIRVCAQGVCAAVEDDGTSLTHPLPSAPQ